MLCFEDCDFIATDRDARCLLFDFNSDLGGRDGAIGGWKDFGEVIARPCDSAGVNRRAQSHNDLLVNQVRVGIVIRGVLPDVVN